MKHITLVLIGLYFMICTLFSQAPNAFKYQAVVHDADGNLITNQEVTFELFIRRGGETGSIMFSETHTVTTNEYGLISFNIGEGTVATGSIGAIDWGTDEHYIQMSMDPDGGTNYQILGISKLLSVPYALYANTSEQLREDIRHDYVYAGGSTLVNNWNGTLTAGQSVDLACAYNSSLLGVPNISNPDTNEYKLFYYLSATVTNNNGTDPYITLNDLQLINCRSWSNPTYRICKKSPYFYSWEQFPEQGACGYTNPGLTIRIENTSETSTNVYLYNISVHYVFIRNGVDYPKIDGLPGYPD
jgi:hypothetical protein